jgi:hypothetical protein
MMSLMVKVSKKRSLRLKENWTSLSQRALPHQQMDSSKKKTPQLLAILDVLRLKMSEW